MPAIPAVLRRGPLILRKVPVVLALLVAALIAIAVAAVVVVAGGGSSDTRLPDPAPENRFFHIEGTADRFAGAAPAKLRFFSESYHNKGKVDYFWRFDDGFATKEKNPTHTFVKPGYYQVLVDARDRKTKETTRMNLFVGIWPKDVWTKAQTRGGINNKTEVSKQWQRTRARKRALIANCLKNPACQKRQLAADRAKVAEYKKEWRNCTDRRKCRKYLIPALRKAEKVVERDLKGIPSLSQYR